MAYEKKIQSDHLPTNRIILLSPENVWFFVFTKASKKIQSDHFRMIYSTYSTNNLQFQELFLTIFSRLNGISEVEKEVDFLLWTEDNPTEPDKLKVGDVFSLHLSHFKADLPTKILIHGFEDTGWELIYA